MIYKFKEKSIKKQFSSKMHLSNLPNNKLSLSIKDISVLKRYLNGILYFFHQSEEEAEVLTTKYPTELMWLNAFYEGGAYKTNGKNLIDKSVKSLISQKMP